MYGYKHPLTSITILASVSAIAGAVLALLGVVDVDIIAAQEAIGAIWSGISSLVAIWGRYRATQRVSDPAAGGYSGDLA